MGGKGLTEGFPAAGVHFPPISRRQLLRASAGGLGVVAAPRVSQSSRAQDAATPGGTLTFALSTDPPNLDPYIDTGAAAHAIKLQAYNSLARYWVDGDIQPDLAESWEISDDGLEYIFKLGQNVLFHDGTPLTAADVQASIARVQDPELGATRQLEMSAIKEMVIEDDHTIRFRLDEPNAALLDYLALPETAILSRQFLESGGDPATTMMGTGPFKFVSYEPGVRIEFARNPDYFHEGLPYLDGLVFVPYAEENTRIAALQGGEVDIAEYIPWKDMDAIETNPDLRLALSPEFAAMMLMYNTEQEPFNDPDVRRALGYAFDRQAIIDAVFFGRGETITGGVIPSSFWAFTSELEGTFGYDPEQAQALLAEAGYGDGLSISLLSTSEYGMYQSTAEVCQQNLRDIGIDCELELTDWATVVQKMNERSFQFMVYAVSFYVTDPDSLRNYFHSESPIGMSLGFADAEVDQLLEEGVSIVDREARKAIYAQFQERLLDLSPVTFLCWRRQGYGVKQVVNGFEQLPGGIGEYSPITLQQAWFEAG